MADDDEDDYMLVRDIITSMNQDVQLDWIQDGIQLMNYLYRRNEFSLAVRPDIILLDLNMPSKNGIEVLSELRSNPYFRRIPIVILSTSKDRGNVMESYKRGASSYMVKPSLYTQLQRAMEAVVGYWSKIVTLPAG